MLRIIILGLNSSCPGAYNTSACLVEDGIIIAAAKEDLFNREKYSSKFPVNAIKFCLNRANVNIKDVDKIVFSYNDPYKLFKSMLTESIKWSFIKPKFSKECFIRGIWNFYIRGGISHLKYYFGNISDKKIAFVPHHLAHASASFFPSGIKKSLIMTIDWRGDTESTFFGIGENNEIKKDHVINYPHSLGYIYSIFTEFLGFRGLYDAGKTMALAAYGKPFSLNELIKKTKNGFKLNLKYFFGKSQLYSKHFIKKFGPPRKNEKIDEKHKNIAASIQRTLENFCIHLLETFQQNYSIRSFCLGGGVALNCKMNTLLLKDGKIRKFFIQPAATDDGNALGAALYFASKNSSFKPIKMEHVYFGPRFSETNIKKMLEQSKIEYEYYSDIEGLVGELLAKGNVVGWFQGSTEWGPRALGNRSVLADPTSLKIRDYVNNKVKRREPWRPLSPTILDRAAKEFFEESFPSPFMNLALKVKPDKQELIKGVVHVDGTSRPQILAKRVNKKFYRLIKSFENEKGIPLILNTSFNRSGNPLVNSPCDAIRCFYDSGLDYLAIENFLIKK